MKTEIRDAREHAENIVETVSEPLVAMDSDRRYSNEKQACDIGCR